MKNIFKIENKTKQKKSQIYLNNKLKLIKQHNKIRKFDFLFIYLYRKDI